MKPIWQSVFVGICNTCNFLHVAGRLSGASHHACTTGHAPARDPAGGWVRLVKLWRLRLRWRNRSHPRLRFAGLDFGAEVTVVVAVAAVAFVSENRYIVFENSSNTRMSVVTCSLASSISFLCFALKLFLSRRM